MVLMFVPLLFPLLLQAQDHQPDQLQAAKPAVELEMTWQNIKSMQQQFPEPSALPQDVLMAPVSRSAHIRQLNALQSVRRKAEAISDKNTSQ